MLAAGSGCALKTKPDPAVPASPVTAAGPSATLSHSYASAGASQLPVAAPQLSVAAAQPNNDTAQLAAHSGVRARRAANAELLGTLPVAGNGRAAFVLLDVNDDEIVARRLKQAAEAETDPELRARLWREYAIYVGARTEH